MFLISVMQNVITFLVEILNFDILCDMTV